MPDLFLTLFVVYSRVETGHRRTLVQQRRRVSDAVRRLVTTIAGGMKRRLHLLGQLESSAVHVRRSWRRSSSAHHAG